MSRRNRNQLVVAGVQNALNQFRNEVAAEIGLPNYDAMDKGWLASRQNGYVGGNMTKKMVAYAEAVMGNQGHQAVSQPTANVVEVPEEIYQLNQQASQNIDNFRQTLAGIQAGQEPTQGLLQ